MRREVKWFQIIPPLVTEMPSQEAPCVELGSIPQTPSVAASPSPSEISSTSSPEPQNIRATPLFRALAMPPPEPDQPPGQEELERRLPGYRRIVIPRELTLIELLKECSGVTTDEDVLRIREARLRVVAERVGLRRLNVLAPRLSCLILDGSALASLRDLGIGLVHLKILSINRCGLSSLDGVWGLGALRELSATGNRFQDLQPLAALQKLHTLNLSNNPITESSRLWTLGVCSALRCLTLRGTSVADSPHYRSRVASTLPMLIYLDEHPLHTDIEFESDGVFGPASSSSGSGVSDAEEEINLVLKPNEMPPAEPEPSSSDAQLDIGLQSVHDQALEGDAASYETETVRICRRRRPATTECAGVRPTRPNVLSRPRTASERPTIDAPTRLKIMNTLMDEEWRCSGSKLTSHDPVCGNLARSLRRTTTGNFRRNTELEKESVLQTVEDASRAVAAEIPKTPHLEDWAIFKQETGIDIDIDFNERPREVDPSKAIDRLERIEKETLERFKQGNNTYCLQRDETVLPNASIDVAGGTISLINDNDFWAGLDFTPSDPRDVFALFEDINGIESSRGNTTRFNSRLE